jgi:putative heavy-metal-binding protein
MIKCQECHAMAVAEHTPEPSEPRPRRNHGTAPWQPAAQEDASLPLATQQGRPVSFLLSTGSIPYKYEIMDLVFASAHYGEGAFQQMQPAQAFQIVSHRIEQAARQLGADAVIQFRFELQTAASADFPGLRHVLEAYGYGTAVRILGDK